MRGRRGPLRRIGGLLAVAAEAAGIVLGAGALAVGAMLLLRRSALLPAGAADPATAALVVAVLTAPLVALLAVACGRIAFGRAWPSALGLARGTAPLGWRAVACATLAWPLVQLAWVALVAAASGTSSVLGLPAPGAGRSVFALWLVLLAPAAEELLFRGYVEARSRRAAGPRLAFALTAALFLASHADGGLSRPLSILPLALALGWLRLRGTSLWACYGLHALSNAAVLVHALAA